MRLNTKRVIFCLVALIGGLVIVIGIYQIDIQAKTVLISIGGALLGASLSNFFSLIGVSIFEILSKSTHIPNIENGLKLDSFRKKYYCYYLTKKIDDIHWRLHIVDYSNFVSNNYFFGEIKTKNDDGIGFEYYDTGLLTGKRLVSISKAKVGNENSVIYFFPNFAKGYTGRSVGLGVFENWNKVDMISPMIISTKPILGYRRLGRIDDSNLEIELQNIVDSELPEIVTSR